MSELDDLDRALRAIRFRPRESLEPELLGRVRRGDDVAAAPRALPRLSGGVWAAGAAAALALAGLRGDRSAAEVTVDRCCYDLDGGGVADDGVLLLAERDDRVRRLRVYEDRDGSGAYTGTDLVRLDRGATPAMFGAAAAELITIERCCLDFDGGGRDDDALLVMGVPPDRVMMAAIYERPADGGDPAHLLPLR
jgi:hypothetical protein